MLARPLPSPCSLPMPQTAGAKHKREIGESLVARYDRTALQSPRHTLVYRYTLVYPEQFLTTAKVSMPVPTNPNRICFFNRFLSLCEIAERRKAIEEKGAAEQI